MEMKALKDIEQYLPTGFVRKRIWQTENLHCNIYCFEPGQQNSLHFHPVSNEVVFCMQGQGDIVVGEERKPIKAGDTVLVPVAVPHGYINTSQDRMVIVVLQCPCPVTHMPVKDGDLSQLGSPR